MGRSVKFSKILLFCAWTDEFQFFLAERSMALRAEQSWVNV